MNRFPSALLALGLTLATATQLAPFQAAQEGAPESSPELSDAPAEAPARERSFESLRRRRDLDLDGRISFEEFHGRRRDFRRLDRDRDGLLSEADFAAPESAGESTPVAPLAEHAPTAEELRFFETSIRPVLAEHCYRCHSESARRPKAELRVDSRAALLLGGVSGPALVPGDPEQSLLIEAVRGLDPDFSMPPDEDLSEAVVRDLERWVAAGAPWPAAGDMESESGAPRNTHAPIDLEKAREFWAYRAPVRPEVPEPRDAGWAWTAIDAFLLARMEAAGVTPVEDAEPALWLRRVTFDLCGLPPTPAELAAFEKDPSRAAAAAVVERLLASRAFGERFGRHWLDVARFGESSGKETNLVYPQAWRYRDWVIDAFARDLPYDAFLRAQLAGDLLPARDDDERAANLVATGYLALGPKSHNARDPRQFALDVADEQIDTLWRGLLGQTISCARCHDHKFDPFPSRDYYALAGILLSSETCYGTVEGPGNNRPARLLELPAGAHVPDGPTMDPELRRRLLRESEALARLGDGDGGDNGDKDKARALRVRGERLEAQRALLARFDEQGRALPANRLAMGMAEGVPRDVVVLERGELERPGERAPRGFPEVLRTPASSAPISGSGRRELAEWIASPENPLTARVWVNRLWLHLFGTGLVATPDDFGSGGRAPSHPELLDWLATELVQRGWSTQALVRELVLSHAYRLASSGDAADEALDPEALLRWRMPVRRLEAEALRDAMLAVAGVLAPAPVGSSAGTFEGALRRTDLVELLTREQPVRSVYLAGLRGFASPALEVFDAPDPSFVSGAREQTTVATQALFLMNDPEVLRLADAFAARLLAREESDAKRIEAAYRLALGRAPSSAERSSVTRFLGEYERLARKEVVPEPTAGKAADKNKSKAERRRAEKRGQQKRPAAKEAPKARKRGRTPEPAPPGSVPPLDPHQAAWSAFAQTLFQSAEFRSLE